MAYREIGLDSRETQNARAGWKEREDAILWEEVAKARSEGRPLKSVFASVAQMTGRKANSVRNYYYAKVREHRGEPMVGGLVPEVTAFVPFTQDEIAGLIKQVLSAQARGQSVRACTLELGRGDNKAMLRYQNKYRSVVKNNPQLVSEIMQQMQDEGMPFANPYDLIGARRRRSRPHGTYQGAALRAIEEWESLNADAARELFRALEQAAKSLRRTGSDATIARMENETRALRLQLDSQLQLNRSLKEQSGTLLSLLRQLIEVNKDFLSTNKDVSGAGPLSDYVHRLQNSVISFEQLVAGDSGIF